MRILNHCVAICCVVLMSGCRSSRRCPLASKNSAGVAGHSMILEEYTVAGFALGCQAYTFNPFSVFEAIQKTAEAGGKCIEFYPGQKLSPDEPNVRWDHHASDETIQKVKD